MAYRVVLDVTVDEPDVEAALAETMMIARSLANNEIVRPVGRTDNWTYDCNVELPTIIQCSVTKVGD